MKYINKDNFEEEVLKNNKLVMVDFFATWCGPCQMLTPVLEKISKERNDVEIMKLDIDQNTELAIRYGVEVVPTIKFFKNGSLVNSLEGFRDEGELVQNIENYK